jgi:serine/threonine protein kinase
LPFRLGGARLCRRKPPSNSICHTLIPSKIGKYEIVRELGRGATSAVFEAVDPFTARRVAVKWVLPEALHDKDHGRRYRKLFITEA